MDSEKKHQVVYEVYLVNNSEKFQQGLKIFSTFERAVQFVDNYVFKTKAKLEVYEWHVDSNRCPTNVYERLS